VTVKKVFASILFGFIALIFVFVGLDPSQFGGGNDSGGAAAIVADRMISLQEFQQAYENRQQQMESQLSQLPAAQRQEQSLRLRDEVLNNLINSEIQSVVAQDLGLVGSDEEVRDYILKIPYLQKDGRFDRTRYDSLLQYLKQSSTEFEDRIRKEIKTRKLSEVFNQSFKKVAVVGDPKAELKAITANLRYIKVDENSLKELIKVSPNQAEAWANDSANESTLKAEYEKRKLNFMDAQRVKTMDEVKFEVAALVLEEKLADEIKLKISRALSENQDPANIESIVKTVGGSWSKTGAFNLATSPVPGLGNIEALMGGLNSRPIIGKVYPQILAIDGTEAIVVFDELRFGTVDSKAPIAKANPFGDFDFESMAVSSEAFQRWLNPQAEKIRVVKNQRIQVQ
jgi:hypothetical protein